MNPSAQYLFSTNTPAAIILVRLMVGGIFLSEGIQKFLYPAELGAGRFAKIGIPWPEVMGPFVGWVEVICGLLILFGLFTRLAAIPLIITMCVALVSTKVPILLGQEFLGFALRPLPRYGFWSMMHASRNDLCMLSGSILLIGAGRCSLHYLLCREVNLGGHNWDRRRSSLSRDFPDLFEKLLAHSRRPSTPPRVNRFRPPGVA